MLRTAIVCKTAVMADARVKAAVEYWAPRFIANGVDPGDFARVTAAIADWDGWCAAWCQGAATHEELGRVALADGRCRSAGPHLAQAAVYYHFAKFLFVQDMDQLRAAHAAAVRCLADALPYLDPPGERIEIPFDGTTLAGILRRPPGPGAHPVVILIAGLDSAKEEFRSTEELLLLLLEEGNHGCANLPYLHRPYSADWMARQLASCSSDRPQRCGRAADDELRR